MIRIRTVRCSARVCSATDACIYRTKQMYVNAFGGAGDRVCDARDARYATSVLHPVPWISDTHTLKLIPKQAYTYMHAF